MKPETQDQAPGIVIDRALLDRARAKDREALGLLYEASSLEIYRTIHALVRDEDLTLDIQQDTYLQAFSHLDQLREPERFLPWLKQIAVNQARAQLRKKRPTLFTELTPTEEGEEPEFPDLSSQASPELSLDRKETTRLVREILDGLTDGQRLLIGLYYYEELSMSQIARELGLSVGTVKSQLHRSRKHVETEVRKLEAQGVKLYGLGPLPFLLTLLHRAEPAAEAEGKLLAASVSQSAAGTAPVLETAAVHVGRSFFQTTLGRVTLGLMAAAVIGGGAVGWRWYQNHLERVMGDARPTVYVDSAEDLSTEPTEPTETHPKPDSGEDLIHVPTLHIPTLTEPTEPTETEPASTAPAETNPPKATDPAGPPDPGSPPATTPTKPTEPQTSQLMGWQWGDTGSAANSWGSMDWEVTLPGQEDYPNRGLVVVVKGDKAPTLSTDNPNVLSLVYGRQSQDADGLTRYYWSVAVKDAGTAHITCSLDGLDSHSLTVHVPSYPEDILSASYSLDTSRGQNTRRGLADCVVGLRYQISASVQGTAMPEFSTDNPSVVQLSSMSYAGKGIPGVYSPFGTCTVTASIVGAGDAHIYLSLNGVTKQSWEVHASPLVLPTTDTQEDLLPFDAPPQVVAWWIDNAGTNLQIGMANTVDVYVKMHGQAQPNLYTDNPAVAVVGSPRQNEYDLSGGIEYWFPVRGLEVGTCTLYCEFNGKIAFSIPVTVQ